MERYSRKGWRLLPREDCVSKPLKALGLMSGTSLDGIDAALVETDGEAVIQRGPARTYSYDEAQRLVLRQAIAQA
ncbi:MAG: anhydro-N-acetylmuramic acid kinase, partial [Rhizobiales bacterium]|nr:anhydro-N-acetylmuramic acid kinase [Hyphomicrobiales bacterium]